MWDLYKSRGLKWWNWRKKKKLVVAMRRAFRNTVFKPPLPIALNPVDIYRKRLLDEMAWWTYGMGMLHPLTIPLEYNAYMEILIEEYERVAKCGNNK